MFIAELPWFSFLTCACLLLRGGIGARAAALCWLTNELII